MEWFSHLTGCHGEWQALVLTLQATDGWRAVLAWLRVRTGREPRCGT